MRPVTQGDILAATRVLLALPEESWPRAASGLIRDAARADRYRRFHGRAHPRLGNGSLMSVAMMRLQVAMPAAGAPNCLAAQGAVIAAILSEGFEGHGCQGATDPGDVEQRL